GRVLRAASGSQTEREYSSEKMRIFHDLSEYSSLEYSRSNNYPGMFWTFFVFSSTTKNAPATGTSTVIFPYSGTVISTPLRSCTGECAYTSQRRAPAAPSTRASEKTGISVSSFHGRGESRL